MNISTCERERERESIDAILSVPLIGLRHKTQ